MSKQKSNISKDTIEEFASSSVNDGSTLLHVNIIERQDFLGFTFSKHYIQWITEELKKKVPHGLILFQNHNIDAKEPPTITIITLTQEDALQIVMFLGYAWGQQDNGR